MCCCFDLSHKYFFSVSYVSRLGQAWGMARAGQTAAPATGARSPGGMGATVNEDWRRFRHSCPESAPEGAREPRESCFGPEYQRGFQEEGGLCSGTGRRGGLGEVKRGRAAFQVEGAAREGPSLESSGSRAAASEGEADGKGPRRAGLAGPHGPSQQGPLTRREAGKQRDPVGVCPNIALASVLKRNHLTGPTWSTQSKFENGRVSVHPRALSPSGCLFFPPVLRRYN